MMANDRWQEWLHRAKERANAMHQIAPYARHELQPLKPAAPTWLEVNRLIPQEQPCGFVRSMIARSHQPQTFFRSFHGKPAKEQSA